MARISGVDLPRDKKVEIGLTYIYGIGRHAALDIIKKAGIDQSLRVRDLTDADVNKLRQVIERVTHRACEACEELADHRPFGVVHVDLGDLAAQPFDLRHHLFDGDAVGIAAGPEMELHPEGLEAAGELWRRVGRAVRQR